MTVAVHTRGPCTSWRVVSALAVVLLGIGGMSAARPAHAATPAAGVAASADEVPAGPSRGTLDGSITATPSEVPSGGLVTFTVHAVATPPPDFEYGWTQVDTLEVDRFGSPFNIDNPNFPGECYPGNHYHPADYSCTFTAPISGRPGEVVTVTMTATGEGQTITREVSVRIVGGPRTSAQWAETATGWPAVRIGRTTVDRDTPRGESSTCRVAAIASRTPHSRNC